MPRAIRVTLATRVQPVQLVPRGRRASKDHQASMEPPEPPEPQVRKVIPAMSVQPGRQGLPALLVLPGRKESKASPVPQVRKDQPHRWSIRR